MPSVGSSPAPAPATTATATAVGASAQAGRSSGDPGAKGTSPENEKAAVVLEATASARLENWRWLPTNAVEGQVYDCDRFKDGEWMSTSVVPPSGRFRDHVVTSSGTAYLLGMPDPEGKAAKRAADASDDGRRRKRRVVAGTHAAEAQGGSPAGGTNDEQGMGADTPTTSQSERTKQLMSRIQCSICMDTFDNPHSLPCTHTFCYDCISEWMLKAKELQCPLCKLPFFRRNLMPNHLVADIVAGLSAGLS
jgi:hypothetical protein